VRKNCCDKLKLFLGNQVLCDKACLSGYRCCNFYGFKLSSTARDKRDLLEEAIWLFISIGTCNAVAIVLVSALLGL
jgi:hypothetical protein